LDHNALISVLGRFAPQHVKSMPSSSAVCDSRRASAHSPGR